MKMRMNWLFFSGLLPTPVSKPKRKYLPQHFHFPQWWRFCS